MVKARIGVIPVVVMFAGLVLAVPAFGAGVAVAPGNAKADGFLPSTACGCHTPLVQQWQPSMHANAVNDPVFLAKVAEAEEQAGVEVARFCKRCHSPIGNMLGEFDGKGPVSGEGVTCMYCHQISGMAKGEPGNTSHLITADQTRRAQIKDPGAPHAAAYSALHESAEICGGCHNVNHPVNGTHLESSYAEWKASPYAKEGVVCQDCHMSSQVGVVGPSKGAAASGAAERDNIYSMTFVGANVGQGPADAATALLKSAATVELVMPEIVAPGEVASATVTITNKGAGHYLPTGLTEVREMWMTLYAENADGTKTELGERRFGTALKDAKGDKPAEMWMATGVASDDRIAPRESVSGTYSFEMPADAQSARVVAELNYRSLPDELATKAKVENPATLMASGEQVVYSSQAAKDAAQAAAAGADKPAKEAPKNNGALIAAIAAAVVVIGGGAWMLIKKRKA